LSFCRIKLKDLFLTVQSLFPKDLKLLETTKNLKNKEISKKTISEIISNPLKEKKIKNFISKDLTKLYKKIKKSSINLLFINEKTYPFTLKNEYGPPLVLFYKGNISLINSQTVSIVGTRRATFYGRRIAVNFSEQLAEYNITIVSGMARGIDTEVHTGALKKGKTISVVGSNLNKIYPAINKKLSEKIIGSGCLISEFSPGYPTLKSNFPLRNRIIAYLSPLTIVIEAKEKSGSLITANFAIETGRDVAAVPGNIDSKNSNGTNNLIKNGAYLIQNLNDILNILPYDIKRKEKIKIKLKSEEKKILELIPSSKITNIDSLIEKTNIPISKLFQTLIQLEIKGLIIEYSGKNYQKRIQAD